MKNILVSIAKLSVAAGLIYWLIVTKKITAEPFIQMWSVPWLIPFVFILNAAMILINNHRWLLLLRGQKIQSDSKQTIPLTFIGMFFNLAMPGSVGGDVIKAYFIAQDHPGTKLGAAMSVLMDRLVGMYAMSMIALLAIVFGWQRIIAISQLQVLALFVLTLAIGFTGFFIVGFSARVRAHDLTFRILQKIPFGKFFEKIYDTVHAFRTGKKQFVWGIILSIVVQGANILGLYVVARVLGYPQVSLAGFCFIIPLGLIATALPISPAGIGVGQAVFLALFTWYYGTESNLGPTLITISQVAQGILGLLGAFFYLTRSSKTVVIKEGVRSL